MDYDRKCSIEKEILAVSLEAQCQDELVGSKTPVVSNSDSDWFEALKQSKIWV
jgi:hypothetical protein